MAIPAMALLPGRHHHGNAWSGRQPGEEHLCD